MSNDYQTNNLHTADNRTWTFNVDELDTFRLSAPSDAKKAVADSPDAEYRNLRSRLVNTNPLGDTFVVVVEVFQ